MVKKNNVIHKITDHDIIMICTRKILYIDIRIKI
jgi:hypothetical protein